MSEERRAAVAELFEHSQISLSEPLRKETREVAGRIFGLGEFDQGPLSPGSLLGPYRVERLLGLGGQAFVYEAVHTELGRRVALKVPRREVADRLLREGRLAARLNHPHIARVEQIAEAEGPNGPLPYLVLEHCPGGSLATRLERSPGGRLTEAQARRVAEGILKALGHAHSEGVVHRDLKPANVLFDERGQVKLADFGIGTVATGGPELANSIAASGLTAPGHVVGTPLYMAPEQERPDLLAGKPLDGRADLFAFGKLLFVLLTGARPSTIRPPSRLRPELDAAWDEFVFRLLEERREARPMDAEAALKELQGIPDPTLWVRPRRGPVPPTPARRVLSAPRAERSEGPSSFWGSLAFHLQGALGLGATAALGMGLLKDGTISKPELPLLGLTALSLLGALFLFWLGSIHSRSTRTLSAWSAFQLGLPLWIWQPVLGVSGYLLTQAEAPAVLGLFACATVLYTSVTAFLLHSPQRAQLEELQHLTRDPEGWRETARRRRDQQGVFARALGFTARMATLVTALVVGSCSFLLLMVGAAVAFGTLGTSGGIVAALGLVVAFLGLTGLLRVTVRATAPQA